MTNTEYIKAQVGFSTSDANVFEAALLDAGVVGTDTYAVRNMLLLKTAAISVLYLILSTPDTASGTGETANSIKYDRDAILKRIAVLEGETGAATLRPTIKGVSAW